MTRIRTEDYTFVTNNRADFTTLYAKEELYAGLIILAVSMESLWGRFPTFPTCPDKRLRRWAGREPAPHRFGNTR